MVALALLALAMLFPASFVNAQSNTVTGTISASASTIAIHSSVTLTCTYTSTLNVQGTGSLEMGGPKPSPTDHFSFSEICWWDTIDSGVPVTYAQQLDATGYYTFRWLCSGGGTDGAYTEVTVLVVDSPSILPEAPPILVLVMIFVAAGAFIVRKKKTATFSVDCT